jgi:hypothetical protein
LIFLRVTVAGWSRNCRLEGEYMITRPLLSIAVLLLATAVASFSGAQALTNGSSSAQTPPSPHAAASVAVLREFLLEPSGIAFGMHPTESRIVVVAAAVVPLEVCQFGTTFSTHWRGGCRSLDGRPVSLPSSGGAAHIGFRVLPSSGRVARVVTLRVRWHCVDRYFGLLRGKTVVRSARPIFDC